MNIKIKSLFKLLPDVSVRKGVASSAVTDTAIKQDASGIDSILDQFRLQEQALNAACCGISIADATKHDFPLIYVNDGFERLTGYSRAEALGKSCRFLQNSERRQASVSNIRSALQSGQGITTTLRNFRKDGTPFWNELTISPICNDQGVVTHHVGIQNDVTEREESRFSLIESRQQLAKRNLVLHELNEEKDRLLGLAAHDVRTPLSAVHSLLDMALQTQDLGSREQLLRMCLNHTHETLQLLSDLLDLSAINTGKLKINKQQVNLQDYFSGIADKCAQFAYTKNIVFNLSTNFAVPVFDFDPRRIEQVMINLVSNAIKFSMNGTCITLSAVSRAGSLELQLADQGQGIAMEDLPKLFEEFSPTNTRPTANESSSGLGLAIVKRIVEEHGGKISVTSKLGEGSCFRVRLLAS